MQDHLEYLKMARVGAMRAVQIHLLIAASEAGKMQINSGYFECIDINYNVLQPVSGCGCLSGTQIVQN